MAIIGWIDIGLGVKTAALAKGLGKGAAQVSAFGSQVGGVVAKGAAIAGGAAVAAGAAGAAGLFKAVTAGSDLSEEINKANVLFGDASGSIQAEAQGMADAFGISKAEFIKASGAFGGFGKSAGMTQQAAAGMGVEFAKLAADASSFFNVDMQTAIDKIRSGLTGESEPMRDFGVFLKEAAVEAEAARMGMNALGGELTEGQKIQARGSLIMRGMADAQGDMARTSEGAANQMRALGGRITNMAAEAGIALAPVTEVVLQGMNEALTAIMDTVTANKATIVDWAMFAGQSVVAVVDIFRQWRSIVEESAVRAMGALQNVGETVVWIGSTIGPFLDWFGTNWQSIFADAFNATMVGLRNLGQNFMDFGQAAYDWIASGFTQPFDFKFTPVMEGFAATTPALDVPNLELSSVEGKIADIRAAAAEEAVRNKVDVGPITPDQLAKTSPAAKAAAEAGAAAVAKEGPKLAGLAELGSTEAFQALANFRAGGSGAGGIEDVAKTSKDSLVEQKKQTVTLKQLVEKGIQVAEYSF